MLRFAFILVWVLAPLAILCLLLVEEIGEQPPQTLLRGAPSLRDSGPPAPTPMATAEATTRSRPTIAELVITEQAISDDSGAAQMQRGLWVCFVLTPSSDSEPLVLAITRGAAPPRGMTDPAVVARVDAGPQTPGPFCHAAVLGGEVLPPGGYHLWVLHRGQIVGGGPFTIAEPMLPSPPVPEPSGPAPESTPPAATPIARLPLPSPSPRATARAVSATAPPAPSGAVVMTPGTSSTPPPTTAPAVAPTASTPVTAAAAPSPAQPSPVAVPPTAQPTRSPTVLPTATRPPPRPPATTVPR